ncbi:MAG: hypothetical protein KDG44_01465 [Burkholderiaceae bacterium]|jgi:hypothetical protein|nr:hypothetical protein [Burkholderiaceae bacterium]
MSPEKPRLRSKRSGVEFEEERAWITFYRRVGQDTAIATEVLAQLEADPEMKRSRLALYLCCKESLRTHGALQARNRRIGQFVRRLCQGLFVVPAHALRRAVHLGGDIAVECLPESAQEPAAPQVRQLTQEPEFAQAHSAFAAQATLPTQAAEVTPSRSSRSKAAPSAA